MRILHVLRAPVGGLFRHVVDLATGQVARGHEVGIVADSATGNDLSNAALAALAPRLALGLHRIPIRRNPHPADLAAVWQVARRIHECGAEIVHGHGAKGGALARLAPAGRAVIRAYTPHGGSLHDDIGGRLHILMERALMPLGQLYLFESAYSHDIYRRKVGDPGGIVGVVHNGIRANELEPVALAADAGDLVYLGELRALKGVDVLIDAVAILRGQGRMLNVKLVGDGAERGAFEAKVAGLGLADCISFCGPLPTRAALALGRVVVLPSRAESLPYVVLESAAAGKPLLATNVGGIPEIFGPYADRLIAPGDAGALARSIAATLDRFADALETARAFRARIAEAFSADAMVDSILTAYQQARAMRRVGSLHRGAHSHARPGIPG
jgi:glycosyltransferase involved in cell wall biosynthesis